MVQLITPQAVDMWLRSAIDEWHYKRQLRDMHCTDGNYWASNGNCIHTTRTIPHNYKPSGWLVSYAYENLMDKFDNHECRWQGVVPSMNLWTGADYACSQCPNPEDSPMQFKGYLFNPKYVKNALLVMNGLVTARLLVDPLDDGRACLHLTRHELDQQFDAYIMCMSK